MADRLVSIDTAKPAGQRFPQLVRDEVLVLVPNVGGGTPGPGTVTLQMLVAGIQATLAKADSALQAVPSNSVGSPQIADQSVALNDLSAAVQTSLAHAESAYQAITNGSGGSPQLADGSVSLAKLTASLQASLAKADTALQTVAANSIGSSQITDGGVNLLDLASNVQTSLSLANTALQAVPVNSVGSPEVKDGSIAVVDLTVGLQAAIGLASTAVQPFTSAAAATVSTALTQNVIAVLNATAGSLAATLPARSAANDNAVFGVQKASADTSVNTVTITPNGADVFDSGAATVTLRLAGELRFVQAVTIGGVRQWKVIGGNTPVSSLDGRYQSLSMVRRPLNNRAVALGDSITELGTDGLLYAPQNGEGWFPRLCISARQRIRYDAIFAKGGATLVDIRDTHLPKVLALNPRPGACFVFGGTNSMGVAHATNVATYLQIVEPLLAAGIMPICVAIPPNDLSSGGFRAAVRQWNRWLRRYAQRNGFPILDAYTALVTVNGSWKAGYSDDQLHPNAVGMKAIADQGIADNIASVFPPNNGQLTIRDTLDLTNMFASGSLNWGLFTTNSGGIGAGLAGAGTGTPSIVAPVTADGLMGNWQRIARASGDAGSGLYQVYAILGGWSAGDTIALTFRVKTANVTPNSPVTVGTQITKTGGFTQNGQNVSVLKQGLVNVLNDVEGTVHVEFVMPAGAENLVFNAIIIGNTSGQTVTVDVGELSVVNLTTNAVLV